MYYIKIASVTKLLCLKKGNNLIVCNLGENEYLLLLSPLHHTDWTLLFNIFRGETKLVKFKICKRKEFSCNPLFVKQ